MVAFGSLLRRLAAISIGLTAVPQALRAEAETKRATSGKVPAASSPHFRVVFVALDGVRAREVFVGPDPALLAPMGRESGERDLPAPKLRELGERIGVSVGAPGRGKPLRAQGPRFVSLPGYAEMLSGRKTRCVHNGCDVSHLRTLLSDVSQTPGVAEGDVVAFASWSRLESLLRDDDGRVWVSAGRRLSRSFQGRAKAVGVDQLLDRGRRSSPSPGRDLYRPDRHTAALALGWIQKRRPVFVFLGLGDADEHAHRGSYSGYLAALRASDGVIGRVWTWLEEERALGRETLLLVTTDHGRARSFFHHEKEQESGDVWFVAAGSLVRPRGVVELGHAAFLRDVAPSIRALLRLTPDRSASAGREICGVLRVCDPDESLVGSSDP